MTQYPEAVLARELGICYAAIALVTDYDTGVEDEPGIEPVTQEEVFGFFDENVDRVRALLLRAIAALPSELLELGPVGLGALPPSTPSSSRRSRPCDRSPAPSPRLPGARRCGARRCTSSLVVALSPRHRARRHRADLGREAARARWGRSTMVAVASDDLAAGQVVGRGDVALREVPADLSPSGALERLPVGETMRVGVSRGEILTRARVGRSGPHRVSARCSPGERASPWPGPASTSRSRSATWSTCWPRSTRR